VALQGLQGLLGPSSLPFPPLAPLLELPPSLLGGFPICFAAPWLDSSYRSDLRHQYRPGKDFHRKVGNISSVHNAFLLPASVGPQLSGRSFCLAGSTGYAGYRASFFIAEQAVCLAGLPRG
jgi:hypothetical protein